MGGTLICQSILEKGTTFALTVPLKRPNRTNKYSLGSHNVTETALNLNAPQSNSLHAEDLAPYLAQIPAEWIEKLHWAAVKSSDQLPLQLIEQIPAVYAPMTNSLKVWVKDFRFDRVIDLIQQART